VLKFSPCGRDLSTTAAVRKTRLDAYLADRSCRGFDGRISSRCAMYHQTDEENYNMKNVFRHGRFVMCTAERKRE
jgi:hypothetical protein